MESENIGGFYFKKITGHNKASEKFTGYNVIDNNRKYSLCFQAAIWNREYLISVLPSGQTPWFIEEQYTLSGSKKMIFCWNSGSYLDCSSDVFPYLWALQSGYGICKSKWLWNNAKLFRKEGIDCKMNTLPHIPRWKYLIRKFLDDALNGKLKMNIKLFDL